jgi:hypothetical protein
VSPAPNEVNEGFAFKPYNYQLPGWLSGSHVVEFLWTDETTAFQASVIVDV